MLKAPFLLRDSEPEEADLVLRCKEEVHPALEGMEAGAQGPGPGREFQSVSGR